MIAQPKRKIGHPRWPLTCSLAIPGLWSRGIVPERCDVLTARQLPPEKELDERRHQLVSNPFVRETLWISRTSALEQTMPT